VVDDAEHKRKLFVKGKNNLAVGDNKSLAYRFRERDVGFDKETGEVIRAPYIQWQDEHVEVTASQAMAATKSPGAKDQAKKFLSDLLADGPTLKTDIEEAADAHGISHRTLVRAKDELGVKVEKEKGKGNKGKWVWRLQAEARIMKAIRTFSLVLGVCAAMLWAIGAVYWDFSAGVEIHNSIDALRDDLVEAAKWNKWAAGFAYAAAAFIRGRRLRNSASALESKKVGGTPRSGFLVKARAAMERCLVSYPGRGAVSRKH
jgi:hypothetical protein